MKEFGANPWDKTLIPLAVAVHHGVCDGFYLSRLLNELEDLTRDFT